ncbi:ATP-dependent DNA helicase Rep [Austwickia sp. TVS 96-490-7B]|uniref:ATP-dependent helicase n=1 Tax=Austwickia sp. TVS 96-490-7B TaxID=2830843 RepID=UPI001C5622C2|nr:ATP-dependent DNA helicase [Austwickia sp. TVS 96-490-7B]MBW3086623.1 ATP-dependent DNA helicase Rep [Austwickia sp. TVS 96-490-7B]
MVVLRRPTDEEQAPASPALDEVQTAAAAHRGSHALVIGAPGTGKTTTAVAAVTSRVAAGAPADSCLVLASSRVAAGALRHRIATSLGRTASTPLARTPSSLAFGILARQAALTGDIPPRLLSGPEQDVVLRELLIGHATGMGRDPGWPDHLAAALDTRGFRGELRDLLMRAAEHGLTPHDLQDWGERTSRPEWIAAARVAQEYDEVTLLSRPGGLDPATLLVVAAETVEVDPNLVHEALPHLRTVIVDDAHDLTPPGARLLRAFAAAGTHLLVLGDPDATTQGFRGGDPELMDQLVGDGPRYVLPRRWRQSSSTAAVTRRVATRIGVVGSAAHRSADTDPARATGQVHTLLARSTAAEARLVADHLRRAHLLDHIPWSQMAVLVRGTPRIATLRRILTAAHIPVLVPGAQTALRDEPVVAALLHLFDLVLRAAAGATDPMTPQDAVALLISPLGGMDAISLRRLRRALHRHDTAHRAATDQSPRPGDHILVAALLRPDLPEDVLPPGHPVRRIAAALTAGIAAARTDDHGRWATGVTAESVLWEIWAALDVAEPWRQAALTAGPGADHADRHLDAAVALFDAAATYVERLPGRGPDGFLDHLRSQDLAADMIVDRAPISDAVTLTTAAGAAGREWDVVAVCGVQEGVWPDLRCRGSILGSQDLVAAITGRRHGAREALAAVRHDETRLFHVAVSRARDRLLVTAVSDDDDQPSAYFDLVHDLRTVPASDREVHDSPETTTPAGLVAALRRQLTELTATHTDPDHARALARRLALLHAEGFPGTDPDRWWPLIELSDTRPRRTPDQEVRLSPSRLETFGQCQLRWLLSTSGGEPLRSGGADAVGSLVHEIAAEHGGSDSATMQAELVRRWPALGLPDGWLSRRRLREAHEMLRRLADYETRAAAEGWTVIGREVPGTAQIGRAILDGRIDRLEQDPDGRFRVVDLKTGQSKRRRDELPRLPQLGAYQQMIESGAFDDALPTTSEPDTTGPQPCRSAGAALLHLGGQSADAALQTQGPLHESDDPTWVSALVTDAAETMAGSTFTAHRGDWCRSCSHRSSCPLTGEGEHL